MGPSPLFENRCSKIYYSTPCGNTENAMHICVMMWISECELSESELAQVEAFTYSHRVCFGCKKSIRTNANYLTNLTQMF